MNEKRLTAYPFGLWCSRFIFGALGVLGVFLPCGLLFLNGLVHARPIVATGIRRKT